MDITKNNTISIGIIDYGMGNLRSVYNACEALGASPYVCEKPSETKKADKLILPGVGAFKDAMGKLHNLGWADALETQVIANGKHFLGICLGMQVLAESSEEHGYNEGLKWIQGKVIALPGNHPAIRVPHIGWNDVTFTDHKEGLSCGLGNIDTFYFIHSYALITEDTSIVKGICSHGIDFAACIEKDNIWATQFHPEKSQKAGLHILNNFINRKL